MAMYENRYMAKGKRDEKLSGTCQACFGRFAIKGVVGETVDKGVTWMVLHGYKRPGWGHTIGRCWGVGQKPYELDCEVTKAWRKQLADVELPSLRTLLERAPTVDEVTITVKDYSKPRRGGYGTKEVTLRPGTEHHGTTFEVARERRVRELRAEVESVERLIKELDERIAAWKYAPENLIHEERKGITVHLPNPRHPEHPFCTLRILRGAYEVSTDISKVNCTRCIAKKGGSK